MSDPEFIWNHPAHGVIQQRCAMIEKQAHELRLMAVRQRMTVTELRAQVMVLQTWLREIESHLTPTAAGAPPTPPPSTP